MKNNKAYLFFWRTNFMYIGKGLETSIHDHHAVQIIINLENTFTIQSVDEGNSTHKAVLIDSDKAHECITGDDMLLVLNIDPESSVGKNLKMLYLLKTPLIEMDAVISNTYTNLLIPLLEEPVENDTIIKITDQFLYGLSRADVPNPLDERVLKTLEILHQQGWGAIRIADIASQVYISQSRLIHLFTRQVGVPIRKYLLWLRLVKAIQQIFKDNNITQAALDAGFSDAPHFNKTLKRMFGINFTSLKNSQNIQAWWM